MKWFWGFALISVLCCGALVERQLQRVESRLETLLSEEKPMTTKWTSAIGAHELTTPRADLELADWIALHAEEVAAAQVQFPPV